MTHPTYTHPGANAALLMLSRAKRLEFVATRRMLQVPSEKLASMTIAKEALFWQEQARETLRRINDRHNGYFYFHPVYGSGWVWL